MADLNCDAGGSEISSPRHKAKSFLVHFVLIVDNTLKQNEIEAISQNLNLWEITKMADLKCDAICFSARQEFCGSAQKLLKIFIK